MARLAARPALRLGGVFFGGLRWARGLVRRPVRTSVEGRDKDRRLCRPRLKEGDADVLVTNAAVNGRPPRSPWGACR